MSYMLDNDDEEVCDLCLTGEAIFEIEDGFVCEECAINLSEETG